ncbi:MAG TPA: GNAT family N-acetyltransferase [Lachnospiraceae bacterium]|nr:GNAT family N-acetyltransferase [Lachnospiraceae bacterium]
MDQDIKIRRFQEEDYEAVIKILVYSFKSKFHALTNLSDEEISQLLRDTGFIYHIPFEGYLVGEAGGSVQGVMLLKWNRQRRPVRKGLRFFELTGKYGALNVCKFIFGLMILQEKLDEDECYIEHVAVNPEARGWGLGTMFLDYGKELIGKTAYLDKLTLHVAVNNKKAFSLYKQQGFQVKMLQSSFFTFLLLKEREWYYMNLRNIK